MFNPTEVVIDAFEKRLKDAYLSTYTNLEPSYPGIISYVCRMALEIIASSDAPYHDLNHTIAVTLVG
ncbi:MAG: metal-dependent phosphohydrolase, partial [Gammaproteobacteria bacterium]